MPAWNDVKCAGLIITPFPVDLNHLYRRLPRPVRSDRLSVVTRPGSTKNQLELINANLKKQINMFKSRNRRRESSNRVIENARLVSSPHPFPLVFPVVVNRVGVRTVKPIYTHFINATRRKFCQLWATDWNSPFVPNKIFLLKLRYLSVLSMTRQRLRGFALRNMVKIRAKVVSLQIEKLQTV